MGVSAEVAGKKGRGNHLFIAWLVGGATLQTSHGGREEAATSIVRLRAHVCACPPASVRPRPSVKSIKQQHEGMLRVRTYVHCAFTFPYHGHISRNYLRILALQKPQALPSRDIFTFLVFPLSKRFFREKQQAKSDNYMNKASPSSPADLESRNNGRELEQRGPSSLLPFCLFPFSLPFHLIYEGQPTAAVAIPRTHPTVAN